MEERIERVLGLLGLTKNERKVFIELTKSGKSTALDIAKNAGIHRPNVYDALRELEKKGLILSLIEENKRFFVARGAEKIKEYIGEIKQEVEDIVPYLKEISQPDKNEEESIMMSKGVFAIRDALTGLLELNAPINVLGASKDALTAFGMGFLQDFHKKRLAKKVDMRHIYQQDMPGRISQLNKMRNTEAKFLPKKYDSSVSTAICGDTVLLIILTHPVSVIKIKNRKIADSYAKYFEILWSKAAT
jgi:sugar-specific transcriptional regulator TrmB